MTNRNQVRLSKLAFGLAVALAAAPAFAQNTSSAVGGRIVTGDGAPIVGAQVTITHTASGTSSSVTTGEDGRYAARGLRVGGPYTITITKDGKTETREGVFLPLASTAVVDATIGKPTTTTLATVEVTGSAALSEVFSANKMGAGTNVSRAQIEAFPSINRNLQDYVRFDPRVVQTDKSRNEISVGGQNPRYNAIRIDGVSTNDTFGLESNSLPTPKQPFSMDTIEEIAVDVANYDVTISGGTGGVINAVTKSGTNEFHGSVYGLYRDDSMVRENTNGTNFSGFTDDKTYGATFGGPLIQDKLFFFINYEKNEQGAPGPTFGPVGSGASNIVNITQDQINQVRTIAQGYGFDAGTSDVAGADTTAEEIGIKIDWNITDKHRANFRYDTSDQSQANFPGFSSTQVALSTYSYQRDFQFDTYSAQLFSDWTDSFSTEAKVSYRDYSAVRNPPQNLPAIAVRIGSATLNLGTEQNTHANILETQTLNAFFAGNLFVGDHTFKFGFDYEDNDIFNLFGRNSNGVYTFNTIADFQAGRPSAYRYFQPAGNDRNNTAADFTLKNLGLFAQDTWAINYNLTITAGIRYDEAMVDNTPQHNAAAEAAFGFDNSKTIDGNGLFQPRFGFNYTFDSERPTQLRGGFGLFQGAAASVWLANPFSNDGFRFTDFNLRQADIPLTCATADGRCFVADPDGQLVLIPANARTGTQSVDFVDPKLGQPSVWKANLAFEHELPFWGLVASAEVVLTNVHEAIFYQQLNLGAPTAIGQDGREIFWDARGRDRTRWNVLGNACLNETGVAPGVNCQSSGTRNRNNANAGFTDAIIARPTSKGESQQLTLSLNKGFNGGDWSWTAAYTFTNAEEVSPLTSSTSSSQWGNTQTFNPNEEVASTANYEIRDRFTASVNWRHAFFKDYKTSVAMFYEGRSGRPYSYVFDNDANGDGRFGNDLLYIPNGPGDVLFGSATEEAAFWAYVEGNGYLNAHRGQVASRNATRSQWVNQIDMRISQELPGFWEGHKSEVWLDMLNVGNMINKKWGQIDEIGFPGSRGVVEYGGIDTATGKYVYRFNTPDELELFDDRGISRWSLQVGFRYKF